nr:BrxA family protein [Sinorhizobium fredii]
MAAPYTTQLQAGLGLVSETKALLDLWLPGMAASQLQEAARKSGRFPTITARRLRNIVTECFGPRYLAAGASPAAHMKLLSKALPTAELMQLMLIFTCRANPILGDFVRKVYWPRYAGGYQEITNDDAHAFVERGIDDGKTSKRWSATTVRRVSAYLTGCCADYGLLEKGLRSTRRILPYRITSPVAGYLAYDLHFAGVGDNALLAHDDWQLFGMSREDVLEELKRLSLKGHVIIQAAGDVVRIGWKHQSMEALCDVLSKG